MPFLPNVEIAHDAYPEVGDEFWVDINHTDNFVAVFVNGRPILTRAYGHSGDSDPGKWNIAQYVASKPTYLTLVGMDWGVRAQYEVILRYGKVGSWTEVKLSDFSDPSKQPLGQYRFAYVVVHLP